MNKLYMILGWASHLTPARKFEVVIWAKTVWPIHTRLKQIAQQHSLHGFDFGDEHKNDEKLINVNWGRMMDPYPIIVAPNSNSPRIRTPDRRFASSNPTHRPFVSSNSSYPEPLLPRLVSSPTLTL